MRSLRPEAHPPTFVPWCSLCNLPVERMAYRVSKEETDTVEFQAQCCGKTQGRRVKLDEMARVHASGEKFYLVVAKNRFQQIRKPVQIYAAVPQAWKAS